MTISQEASKIGYCCKGCLKKERKKRHTRGLLRTLRKRQTQDIINEERD